MELTTLITLFSIFYGMLVILLTYLTITMHNKIMRFIVKMITSVSFLIMYLVLFFNTLKINYFNFYNLLITFILCILGDLFLGIYNLKSIKKKLFFMLGLIFFFLAHISFVLYFSYFSNISFSFIYIITSFISGLIMIISVERLNIKSKLIGISVVSYSIILALFFTSAILFGVKNNNIFPIIGSILFTISDYSLLFKYFYHKNYKLFSLISTSTYFIAQYFIILSII